MFRIAIFYSRQYSFIQVNTSHHLQHDDLTLTCKALQIFNILLYYLAYELKVLLILLLIIVVIVVTVGVVLVVTHTIVKLVYTLLFVTIKLKMHVLHPIRHHHQQ